MIIRPDGTVRFLTVAEHLQRRSLVYQDQDCSVYMHPNKREPFLIQEGNGNDIYIDLFALRFGQKEQLSRRMKNGVKPICYGCPRAKRDVFLFLPAEQILDHREYQRCSTKTCQYWSHPVGMKGRFVIDCILIRIQALDLINQKTLTLEEIGRIYGCTRERIRQIQDRALERLRHYTRSKHLEIFQERICDYRDYGDPSKVME